MNPQQPDSDELRKEVRKTVGAIRTEPDSTYTHDYWVNDLMTMFDQALAQQRAEIVAALPEKRIMTNMKQSPREQLGMTLEAAEAFNTAIDQVKQIINGMGEMK